MHKLFVLLASLLFIATPLISTTPAQASTAGEGGVVTHVNDNGYDASIIVFCEWGDYYITNADGSFTPKPGRWEHEHYVQEGSDSKADCGEDTDIVYIRKGEHLVCRTMFKGEAYWYTEFDKTGPHKINDFWGKDCALKKD